MIFYLSIIFNSDVNFLRFSKISLISSADHDARGRDRRNKIETVTVHDGFLKILTVYDTFFFL